MTAPDKAGLAHVHALVGDLLRELDRVCRDHDLRYFLAYGTLLGAVREGGIIPWDVDADVWVPSTDLPRMVEVLRKGLSAEYELLAPDSHDDYEYLFPRLVRRGVHHVYLRVDLFPLDPAPRSRWLRWCYIRLAHLWCQVWFVRRADTSVRLHYSRAKRWVALVSGLVARAVPERLLLAGFERLRRSSGPDAPLLVSSCGSYRDREFWPRDLFRGRREATLGPRSFPVPVGAEELLAAIYGDWRTPVDAEQRWRELVAASRDFVAPLRAQGVIDP